MPHFTVEYSANLEAQADLQAFCAEILRSAVETGAFETGAVRVRAFRAEHYAIADQHPANSFIDVSLRLAAGRTLALRQQIGERIFSAMTTFLAPLFETQHFALSFEIREIDPEVSYKKNSIHERLRK